MSQIGQTLEFLPLALDLVAAQLREHTSWTLADLLKMLQDERKRLPTLTWGSAGVRAAFNQSYDRLHPDEQKFFAALGAFAGDDFDARAAAFVGETTPDAASAWLERFLRLSLAQEGRRAERYKLHPLLRACAQAEGQARGTASTNDLRMARYYCALAEENEPKLETDIETALPILDADISNIYAGQQWARSHDNQVGWELCRDFIGGAMTYYFNLRAMWNNWIEWGEAGLQACRKLGDERGEGVIAGNLGAVYMQKGE